MSHPFLDMLTMRSSVRHTFLPLLSPSSIAPLLASNKELGTWVRSNGLKELRLAWGADWAWDLFETARTFKHVLKRESAASHLATQCYFLMPSFSWQTSTWLATIATLHVARHVERDSLHSLLACNPYSAAMWTCYCAALDEHYEEAMKHRSKTLHNEVLNQVVASLCQYEDARLHEVGIGLLEQLFTDIEADVCNVQNHVVLVLDLACHSMESWPENRVICEKCIWLAYRLLRLGTKPLPLIQGGYLSMLLRRIADAVDFHESLGDLASRPLDVLGPKCLQILYDSSQTGKSAFEKIVSALVKKIMRAEQHETDDGDHWHLLTMLAFDGPEHLCHTMIELGAIKATHETMWRLRDLQGNIIIKKESRHVYLATGAGFLVALGKRLGHHVLLSVATEARPLIKYMREMKALDLWSFYYSWSEDAIDELLQLLPKSAQEEEEEEEGNEGEEEGVKKKDDDFAAESKQKVLEESIQSALQEESAHVMEAMLRTKTDEARIFSNDGVVLLRMTRQSRSPQVAAVLRESPLLTGIRNRVFEAGCETMPDWAGGATLLVPWTPEQLDEFTALGHEIEAHHIVALARDIHNIKDALRQSVPNRQRPRVALERPAQSVGCVNEPCAGEEEEEDVVEDVVIIETGLRTNSSVGYPHYE